MRPDRTDQHQAEPQPPVPRQGRADPAVLRPYRHRHPGQRPTGRHRGRFVQHGSRFQRPVEAVLEANAFRACDHRRYRQRNAGQDACGLVVAGGRLQSYS